VCLRIGPSGRKGARGYSAQSRGTVGRAQGQVRHSGVWRKGLSFVGAECGVVLGGW